MLETNKRFKVDPDATLQSILNSDMMGPAAVQLSASQQYHTQPIPPSMKNFTESH